MEKKPLTKHPETRSEINEKTVSICIDRYQEKFPLIHVPDLTKIMAYH
jgi:hypothetical protein